MYPFLHFSITKNILEHDLSNFEIQDVFVERKQPWVEWFIYKIQSVPQKNSWYNKGLSNRIVSTTLHALPQKPSDEENEIMCFDFFIVRKLILSHQHQPTTCYHHFANIPISKRIFLQIKQVFYCLSYNNLYYLFTFLKRFLFWDEIE